jgi:hypothetical protein
MRLQVDSSTSTRQQGWWVEHTKTSHFLCRLV